MRFEPRATKEGGYQWGEKEGGKIIAEYVYYDKDGEPYSKVVRTENKQFPQYRYVNGAWFSGAPPEKIPYQLPVLIAAPKEEIVIICEGEKDAEAALDLGYKAATTASGGAGGWTKDLNEWFKGRHIAIIEDNDRPGHNHAIKVGNNLLDIANSVKLINLGKDDEDDGFDLSDWIAAGGTKESLDRIIGETEEYVGFKVINLVAGKQHETIDQIDQALALSGQPALVRAGLLVQPIFTRYQSSVKGKTVTITNFKEMLPSNLKYMLTKHVAVFQKWNERIKDLKVTDPPEELLRGYLELGHWRLPHVTGAINTPTLRPDLSIFDDTGYDEATGLWHWPDKDFHLNKIKAHPTKEEALDALKLLEGLLEGFPFERPLDKSVALAAILTVVARGAFDLSPMFAFLAHAPGTGKSYLVNLISTIATGLSAPVITFLNNREEMEKRLGSLILAGLPLISLDNCSSDLGGDLLCQVLEQPRVAIRVLGQSKTPICEWRGTMFATGNNISVVGDLIRRTMVCKLDALDDRPELRDFSGNKPIDVVLENRGKFVNAALTICRAGARRPVPPIASYEAWSNIVRAPLLWLGLPDPAECWEDSRKADPENVDFESLIEFWARNLNGNVMTGAELINMATQSRPIDARGGDPMMSATGNSSIPTYPELYEVVHNRAHNGRGYDARKLGWWLRKIKGRIHKVDGQKFRIMDQKRQADHALGWSLRNV